MDEDVQNKLDQNADLDHVNSDRSISSFESEEIQDTPDKPRVNYGLLMKSQEEKATKDQLELLNLLKTSYHNTTRELLKLCMAHDQYQGGDQALGDIGSQTEM